MTPGPEHRVEPAAWARIKELFQEALEVDAGLRATFVAERCGEDMALKRSVETLLAAHERAGDFLEPPASVRR